MALISVFCKKDNTEDANYRDTIKRKYAGAKGIGRLSCDRLGRWLTLTTKSFNNPQVIEMSIDWHDYEINPHQEFDEVPVSYEILESSDILSSQTGTVLKISGLHDAWSDEEILNLRKSRWEQFRRAVLSESQRVSAVCSNIQGSMLELF